MLALSSPLAWPSPGLLTGAWQPVLLKGALLVQVGRQKSKS